MKISEDYTKPLIRQVVAGLITRSDFPELWRKCKTMVIAPGATQTTYTDPLPAKVPDGRKHDLIAAILRGDVDTSLYPELWAKSKITIKLPTNENSRTLPASNLDTV